MTLLQKTLLQLAILIGVVSILLFLSIKLPPVPKKSESRCSVTITVAAQQDVPGTLNIDGKVWYVEISNVLHFKGYQGYTDCRSRTILYDFYPTETEVEKRVTLWHEIGHAIRCDHPQSEIFIPGSNVNTSIEHKSVNDLGMGMAPFVHDNPEFIDWAMNWRKR